MRQRVLFVCMGNICRSPTAEGVTRTLAERGGVAAGFEFDSAGTHGYHIGQAPDARAVATALNFGVDISHLRARKVGATDFHQYDLIIAMDNNNYQDLQRIRPAGSMASLQMMMQYHPDARPEEVPDPYYGGMDGFTCMCELLKAATMGLLENVEGQLGKL